MSEFGLSHPLKYLMIKILHRYLVEYFVYIVLLVRAHMGIFLASNVIYRSQHISPWCLVIWQFVRDQFAQGKKHKAKDVVKVFLVEMLTYV